MINSQGLIIFCLLFAAVLAGKTAEEADKRIAAFEGGLSDAMRMFLSPTDLDPLDDWKKLPWDLKAFATHLFDECTDCYGNMYESAGKTVPRCALILSRRFIHHRYLECRNMVKHDENLREKIDELYKNGEFLDFFTSVMIKHKNEANGSVPGEPSYEVFQKIVVELLPSYREKATCKAKAYLWGGAIAGKPRKSRDIQKDEKHSKYFEKCIELHNQLCTQKLPLDDWKKLPEDIRALALDLFEMYLKLEGLTFDMKVLKAAAISAYAAFSEITKNLTLISRNLVQAATNKNLLQKFLNIMHSQKYLDFLASFCIECGPEQVLKLYNYESSSEETTALQEKVLELLRGYSE